MKTFKINKKLLVVCVAESTRNGFRHLATLIVNGDERETAKCTYINRTWERYQYESVLNALLVKIKKGEYGFLDDKEQKLFAKKIKLQEFSV